MNQISWTPGVTIAAIEQDIIQAAFSFYRGNKTATAQSLGISIRTLDNKLERYAQEQKGFEDREAEQRKRREEFLARSRGVHAGQFDTAATPFFVPPNGSQTPAGFHSQPIANAAAESAVPVSQSAEVQGLLSKKPTEAGALKRR